MTVRFRRIAATQVDPRRVTVVVLMSPGGSLVGRVSTLALRDDGGVELMSTEGADPPIGVALQLATEVAAFKEEDVDVVDADGLWQADWGELLDS